MGEFWGRLRRNSFTTKDTKEHEGKTRRRSAFAFLRGLCGFPIWVLRSGISRDCDGRTGLFSLRSSYLCLMATYPVRRLSAQEVSRAIITAAMRVHTELGPGLLESAYQSCLRHELRQGGVRSEAQVGLPVVYRGTKLDLGYRIDLLVEDLVIVEIKSVEGISPVHQTQVISYLELSGKSLGLLINFNVVHLKDGIKRFVNGTRWQEKQEL
jgi:GxxExxY protein